MLISPPRHPLQVMNSTPGQSSRLSTGFGSDGLTNRFLSSSGNYYNRNDHQIRQYSNGDNYISSISEPPTAPGSRTSTPGSGSKSYSGSPLGRSPAIERLMKKISKKNGKGETPLHTAAIKGKFYSIKIFCQRNPGVIFFRF